MKIKIGLYGLLLLLNLSTLLSQTPLLYPNQGLKNVTFAATDANFDFNLVHDSGTEITQPQWDEAAPWLPVNLSCSGPVGYVSGATPEITAVFNNCPSSVYVKGVTTLELDPGNIQVLEFRPSTVPLTPNAAQEITYGPTIPIVSSSNMPFIFSANTIRYIEEFNIEWKMCNTNSTNEDDWVTIGENSNKVYVTYAKPDALAPFHTVIHLGCSTGNSLNGSEEMVGSNLATLAFVPFNKTVFNVKRTSDNQRITYYDGGITTSLCLNLSGVLNPASTPDGTCGAIAELFYRVLVDQGLQDIPNNPMTAPQGISIRPDPLYLVSEELSAVVEASSEQLSSSDVTFVSDNTGQVPFHFLVKNWSGYSDGTIIPLDGMTLTQSRATNGEDGIKGQGNVDNPISIFSDHTYVEYNNIIYDPSYGNSYSNSSLANYEDNSIDVVKGVIFWLPDGFGDKEYYMYIQNTNTSEQELERIPLNIW